MIDFMGKTRVTQDLIGLCTIQAIFRHFFNYWKIGSMFFQTNGRFSDVHGPNHQLKVQIFQTTFRHNNTIQMLF